MGKVLLQVLVLFMILLALNAARKYLLLFLLSWLGTTFLGWAIVRLLGGDMGIVFCGLVSFVAFLVLCGLRWLWKRI